METKTYLTAKRIESLKKYLEDCKNGKDHNLAWKEHKDRMESK